ncbi:KR domain-containing protein [Nocardia sp. NPDC052566]|uniref:KR domain-containing protein n=1 Tax=Nocardia sp. NPDC052566 TaxID=3364330 RepID=UPI0037C869C0
MTTPALERATGLDYPDDRTVLPVRRFVWRPREVAALPDDVSDKLAGRRVAVIGGGAASAANVVTALAAAGALPVRLDPAAGDDSVAEFYAAAGALDGIVDLNYERPLDIARPDGWQPHLLQTVALLRHCYDDWSTETDCERLFYVALTRLDGRHGYSGSRIAQPLGGLWAGLAKSLPREFDNVNIRVLDLPSGAGAVDPVDAEMAALLCRELYRWGYFEIGYAEGGRYTLVPEQVDVPDPVLELGSGDVVVMSGGGRGIGLALARRLCLRYGCRLIISGRSPAPDPDDERILFSDNEYKTYRDRRLIEAAKAGALAEVRAELARVEQSRELAAELAAARRDGLDITYRRCDVVDPAQVRELLAAAGPRLAGVVHNAGLDAPVRLPAKTAEVVRGTVEVKVTGLCNLLDALAELPPVRFFSSVGSLSGRWGGMVGQLEYGAANDALARIGLWAAARAAQSGRAARVPVTTMCWPTWERLGIITNYEATLAYMSAMKVDDGLDHWERELLADDPGERTFMGESGKALLLPTLLCGYPPSSDVAAVEQWANRLILLGTPIRFARGRALETEIGFAAEYLPACTDFRVDGAPAIPLSVLLEFLRSLGDWVQPHGAPRALSAMRQVWIDLAGVRADGRGAHLRASAEGAWTVDRTWVVTVRVTRGGALVARGALCYGTGSENIVAERNTEPAPRAGAPIRELRWNGQVLRVGALPTEAGGSVWVEADRPRDLVFAVPAPAPELPLNQLETMLLAAYRRQAPDHVRHLDIAAIDILGHDRATSGRVAGDGTTFAAYTEAGRLRLALHGTRYGRG